MNFLFVCGGTAGHINPALAIASEILQKVPDAKILFVGAGKELEKRLIPRAGFHVVNIRMSGLRRGFSPDDVKYNLNTLRNLTTAGVKSGKLLRRFKPDAVIGTGGYICYPVMKKAAQMGIPTLVHESNAVPGLTTKLLSSSVDKVLVSFPGLEKLYRRPDRVVFTGTPVRSGFSTVASSQSPADNNETKADHPKPLIVSFWGSLGAEHMNEMMAEFIKLNTDHGLYDHIHATGRKGGVGIMKSRLEHLGAPYELPPGIEIREYIEDMPSVMAAADVILCRAGASTLAELAVAGKPAVLVPSPYVTNNQQVENARQMQKAGGAIMLAEKDCTGRVLYETISSLLCDKDRYSKMSDAQIAIGVPDSAERIVELVLDVCQERRNA